MRTRNCSRRDFLKAAGAAASAISVPALVRGARPAGRGKRRAILFIQTDSQDGRVLGCMGHPAMRRATPNIDALAQRGVLFRNAYCNNPICCPSRASMWSGLYTHHCEGWNNYKGLSPTDPTFRTRLDEAGYLTQTFGKTDILSGQHSIRARVSAWTRSANIERPQYRMGPPRVVEEDNPRLHSGDWTNVDRCAAWLKDVGRSADRPFLLYLGISAPHPAFTTCQRYLDRIDEAGVTVPPADEQDHPVMRYQRIVKNWMHGFSDEMVRQVRRIYFAMCAEVDAMVGALLDALQEQGLADSTYVIFSSDHGENAMEHRQFYKMNLYESSARVPLVIAGPDLEQGAQIETPVSLVDIHPTLMDMAGCDTPPALDGHSLMPEVVGRPSDRPDWALSEYHDTTINTGNFMLRRGDWKYIVYVGYDPQLFHLKDDPDEVRNLAGKHPDVVRQMDDLLRSIVDYRAVDAKVKAYDKRSFRQWRNEMLGGGEYRQTMARIFSGWDNLPDDAVKPWTDEEEVRIGQWLESA
jgi:arylsulfatase K